MSYLTGAGLNMPRQADFLREIRREYQAQTGQTLDLEYDSALGALVSVVTLQLDQVAEAVQGVYDSSDENNATGGQLESLAAITGIIPFNATPSKVDLTCRGTPGTVIPAGAIAEGGGTDGRARWTLDIDITIPASGIISGVMATCQALGPTVAAAEAIDKIVTPIPGWEVVSNKVNASVGRDEEEDGELRVRRRLSTAISGQSPLGALRAAVLALPFITGAAFSENATGQPIVYGGIQLPANSVAVIVRPNPLTLTQIDQLASVIYSRIPLGIRCSGGLDQSLPPDPNRVVNTTVQGADGLPKPIGFGYPVEVTVSVSIGLREAPGFTFSDVERQVVAAVTAYGAGLDIADDVRRTSSSGLVSAIYAGVEQGSIQILETPLLNGVDSDIEVGPFSVATLGSVVVTRV